MTKHSLNKSIPAVTGILVAFLLAMPLLAQEDTKPDPVDVNPGKYTVVFENERVRLLEYRDAPGDESVAHWHPDHLVYSLSEWEREFINPDGSIVPASAAPGDTIWAGAGTHSGRNTGNTETHALIFELKE